MSFRHKIEIATPSDIRLSLEYFDVDETKNIISVPLPTLVTLCVMKQANCHVQTQGRKNVQINFYRKEKQQSERENCEFHIKNSDLNGLPKLTLHEKKSLECVLPAVEAASQNLCITGLCSVLRFLIVHLNGDRDLLGIQEGCLSAPAEVSTWTRFCEVDMIEAVEVVYQSDSLSN